MPKGGLEKSMFITKIWPDAFAFSLCSMLSKGYGVFELHMHTVITVHGIAFYLMSVCPCFVDDMKRVKPTRCYTMVY